MQQSGNLLNNPLVYAVGENYQRNRYVFVVILCIYPWKLNRLGICIFSWVVLLGNTTFPYIFYTTSTILIGYQLIIMLRVIRESKNVIKYA